MDFSGVMDFSGELLSQRGAKEPVDVQVRSYTEDWRGLHRGPPKYKSNGREEFFEGPP
jgi:hypothetical protein